MDIRVSLMLFAEALLALVLLWRSGCLKTPNHWSAAVTLLLAAFVPRLLALPYETLDYQNFLSPWVSFYRTHGGFAALGTPVGNYNVPYLYFLALFSYSSIRDLYLIKLLSILFDVLLAWGAMRLVARLTESPLRRLGAFFAVLFLPTVFLNGAFWGQCDSIYAALAVLALANALEDRPWSAMTLLALSFGFKLQAVFVMPVFAALLFAGKIQWKHLPVFPLAYVLLILPAVCAGRGFWETLTLYLGQTGSVGSGLNYNSPSIFAFFKDVYDAAGVAQAATIASAAFMLLILGLCFVYRKRLDDRMLLIAAVLLSVGIPFLLPHMHDRYFFCADILSLILAFGVPLLSLSAAMTQFASLLGYYAYLVKRYLLLMDHGARALALLLILLGGYFAQQLKTAPEKQGTARAEKMLDNRE